MTAVLASRPVDDAARAELERKIREACDTGNMSSAVTQALTGYGPELFGFLIAVSPSETDASDTFSELGEALLRGIAGFAWDSSLRTWLYATARNILRTQRRDRARRERRAPQVSDSVLEHVAARVRTETQAHLKTEARTRLQALRDALPDDDRALLVLRIDRQLTWEDVARVLADGDGPKLEEAALKRETARLRKRLQLVSERLREQAKREGLLE
jgi:RNA polymerase sigma-70 factor, ECF subfamily